MKPVRDFLKRSGYRLPTEEEWECACRAGARTSRYYGESVELLRKYGWYVNADSKIRDVARLKPNDWGLFDMHGNVWNWCQTQVDESVDTPKRVFRGGSYTDAAAEVRAAYRLTTIGPSIYIGFRPARTLR
jgi:formylglycine-generating enzyme required for sulfatase activity